MLLLTKESIKPLANSGGAINYGFMKVKIKTYKSDAAAVDHLISNNEMGEVEVDSMESSSDVKSIERGESSLASELVNNITY